MRVLIADDHALIRAGLATQLERLRPLTVREAATWDEALAAAGPALDLALVDIRMPGRPGLTGLAEFVSRAPTLPVLVVSATEDVQEMRAALHHGAMGFVTKAQPPEALLDAVKQVLEGEVYLPPPLRQPGHASPGLLTERQREVLTWVAQGKSNDEIAQLLSVSRATVKLHLAAVFRALDVVNRTQAAVEAERLGLARRS